MLTLRTVCRTASARSKAGVGEAEESGGTLIFDEIDTGIGGRVAEVVGRRLRALSANRQVLCVTHQPQIARFADYHYVVAKRVEHERTITSVRELSREERVGELARMIGGAETVETARATANWMLEHLEETEAAPKRVRAQKSSSEEPKMSARRPSRTQKGKGSRLAPENSATLAGRK
jgi:DNA repair protein RecN (Recombination protein N)